VRHVVIYVGNNKLIHASSGGGKVQYNSLSEGYYHDHYIGARRVIKSSKSKHSSPTKSHHKSEAIASSDTNATPISK
jgi:hypothetical protein